MIWNEEHDARARAIGDARALKAVKIADWFLTLGEPAEHLADLAEQADDNARRAVARTCDVREPSDVTWALVVAILRQRANVVDVADLFGRI